MSVNAEPLPRVGLIVPPAHGSVPDDGSILYPGRVQFIARGLALEAITLAGYDAIIDSVTDKAKELAEAGAQAISLMGTSLSFYRGAAFKQQLASAIRDATGLPSTTMSHAVVRALKATGVRRVAVATAYVDDVNVRLASFLQEEGFELTAIKGLAITDVIDVGTVSPEKLIDLAQDVFALDSSAQGVLISCGGLKTLGIINVLEMVLGVPVVSSSPAGFWDAVQLLGINPTAHDFGRLFQEYAQTSDVSD
ncbi:aspartate/glutamate racemase family protein [Bradyrhizobium erythrophlei]|uniref:Arylmalonate decarboxylase n=1 Tax=Bradyrhizobium erythrophlei TaxID=1437360 RepID=A0A1M5SII1_9BRAD|nr:aspartate/glutamate racemase family protein [Bradyrhizobium erythrophlei]SHH38301.1 arylmalonate decarboxylase [Bradyrhizobium erythrophlei]